MAKFIKRFLDALDISIIFTDLKRPDLKNMRQVKRKFNSDADALRSDWEAIGKDLDSAIKKYSKLNE